MTATGEHVSFFIGEAIDARHLWVVKVNQKAMITVVDYGIDRISVHVKRWAVMFGRHGLFVWIEIARRE